MVRSVVVVLLLVFAAGAAQAQSQFQMRTIPANAKRAILSHVQDMEVEMNGLRTLLTAGAVIRDDNNRVVVPSAVPPGSLVKYQLDLQGQVSRVWILTPQEAAQPDPKP